MRSAKMRTLIVVGSLLLASGSAFAGSITNPSPAYSSVNLQFTAAYPGGAVAYYQTAVGTPLQSDALIDGTHVNTPSFQDTVCFGCTFLFTTGAFIGNSSTDWFFRGGGSLSFTGPLFTPDENPLLPSITLFQGNFIGPSDVTAEGSASEDGYEVFNASVSLWINPELTSLFSIPPGHYVGSLYEQTTGGEGCGPDPLPPAAVSSSCIQELYLNLQSAPAATPEPGTFFLFGTSSVAALAFIRRRFARSR